MIFISHSSKNINIVEPLVDFLKALGIKSDQIFCSSIEGNGVKNGLRIPDECKKQIQAANLVVYLITNDFFIIVTPLTYFSSIQAIPGKVLPSRYSNEAPPPVET